jgi:hypothetical protein
VLGPEDDYPHPVPPQAFMLWKENWVFPAVDTKNRVATLFHFSLRPGLGEGIFTAKFAIDGWEHRYVGRSPIPRDLNTFQPVQNEKITFTIVKPAEEFHLVYTSDELDADVTFTARFPAWDFDAAPKAPCDSVLGDIGRGVFPFHHMEQSLMHEGVIKIKAGPKNGTEVHVSGYANRDHSWGWREDLTFNHHHWICASFEDRFIEGAVMEEASYPHGPKQGGWISTSDGNDAVISIDSSSAYWLDDDEPLPVLDRDVRYRLRTVGGEVVTVIAHLSSDYGRLYLDARSKDRTKVYQDVQTFCDFTIEETGQRGSGVLEIGKFVQGERMAERAMRSASRV